MGAKRKRQKGLSILELIISLIISIPIVILIQEQIMGVVNAFINRNILISFKNSVNDVSRLYPVNGVCNNNETYKLIQASDEKNSLYKVEYNYFKFYMKDSCEGTYFLGLFFVPKTMADLNVLASDVLGTGGGYLLGGDIVSFHHSFKDISANDFDVKSGSVFAYLVFRKRNDEFMLTPQDIYWGGEEYKAKDEVTYNICPLSKTRDNDIITLTWNSDNYRNIHVNLIVQNKYSEPTKIKLPDPLFHEIYYVSIEEVLRLGGQDGVFGFEVSDSAFADKNIAIFPQKFCYCCSKYGV